jgi:hypothetical protein
MIGVGMIVIDVSTPLLPDLPQPHTPWRAIPGAVVFVLASAVVVGVVVAEAAAMLILWRRRLAARVWYRDPRV